MAVLESSPEGQARTPIVPGFYRHAEGNRPGGAITRSSALFYAASTEQLTTEILFTNYWRFKNAVEGVTLTSTLRYGNGDVAARVILPIDFTGARRLRLADLLSEASLPPAFEGSWELEFIATCSLNVPYPAVVVRYSGPGWHSMTHTCCRILSAASADDTARIEALQRTCEGNWTVFPDRGVEAFFIVHNGPQAVGPHDLRLRLISHAGVVHEVVVPETCWGPYETRLCRLGDFLPDAPDLLGGQPGTIEIETLVNGVFPRLICGTRRLSDGAMSVDHSNFSYASAEGARDTFSPNGSNRELCFLLPTLAAPEWRCFVDFYPTFPDRGYEVRMRGLDRDGHQCGTATRTLGTSDTNGPVRVEIDPLVQGACEAASVDFDFRHASRLPRRFHMGIHYAYRDGLPAFIVDGPVPSDDRPLSTRWCPVFATAETRTQVLIAHRTFTGIERTVNIKATLFNAFDEPPLEASTTLAPDHTLALDVRTFFGDAGSYLGSEPGWLFLKFDPPSHSVVHYLTLHGHNSVAADHAF